MNEPEQPPSPAWVRSQAISGVRWISLASAVRIAAQFAQVAILARILSPSDFGNMAVVIAFTTIAQIFADMGVSNALFSRGEIAAHRLSSLYWLNVAAGAGVALLLAAAGPAAASFYSEPALQPLLAMAALYLFVNATCQQLRVLAEKDLRFRLLAAIEIAASLVGLAVAVLLALRGAGVYSLMEGLLASAAVGAVLVWTLLARGWRPQLRLRLGEIREFLEFGGYMMGNNLANAASSQIDVVFGARILGAAPIGLYSMPKNLCLQVIGMVNPVVTRVGLPLMARSQSDPALLKAVYLKTIGMTASANVPIFAALAVFAPEVVRLVFGLQWVEAIPLLQIFAAWGLMRSTVNPIGSLLLACGRAELMFRWNVAWLLVCIPAVLAGSRLGVGALAATLAGIALAAMFANWYFLVRPLSAARFAEYFRQIALPCTICAAAAPAGYLAALPFAADWTRLAAGLGCGAAAYVALSYVFNRDWLSTALELLDLKRT